MSFGFGIRVTFPRKPIDEEGAVSNVNTMATSVGCFSWMGLIAPGYPVAVIFVVFVRCSFSSNRPSRVVGMPSLN